MNPSELFNVYLKDLGSASAGLFLAASESSELRSAVGFLRVVSIVLSLIFVVLITWLVRKTNIINSWKQKYYQWYLPSEPEKKTKKLGGAWQVISDLVDNSLETGGYRPAVLAADDLLNSVLDELTFVGATVAEKLHRVTPAEIRNLGELIQAHKTVSAIRENPKIGLSQDTARELIKTYAVALQELGFLTQPRR